MPMLVDVKTSRPAIENGARHGPLLLHVSDRIDDWLTGLTRDQAMRDIECRRVPSLDRHVERGAQLAVARATLPRLEEEDEFYVFELVGLSVEEEGGRLLGRVREVLEYPGNDVLELDSGASLPLVEACVRQVDLTGRRIVVAAGFADPE